MFKKIFIALILLLLIAFGGVSYYISTIDWNNYKSKITSQIEEITGKKVLIGGKINLEFLPTPHLSASNIKIYNPSNGGSEVLAEIKEMVTDISLLPLIHKRFEINKMNLVDAKVSIEFLTNGQTNWHSNVGGEQNFNLSGVDIAFNSVTLQNSTVHILNPTLNLDIVLNKLNADISAQSLNGPFRMDGNFVKDNTPAVFALYVGTLSDTFSTSLNLVLTHPASDSQAAFDGSLMSNNSEIQGNFTIESKKPSTFLNTIAGQTLIPEKYNYPLDASVELIVNPEQVNLSSFVIKYGDDLAGAGRVSIPLKADENNKKTIELSFEMTDFDIMPFVATIKEYIKKLDDNQKPYNISLDYDVLADITSSRAHYNDEIIHDFKFSADLIDNNLKITTLSGILPGETTLDVHGKIFEQERQLAYDLNIQAISQDVLKFLDFTGYKPTVYAQGTYKNARTSFNIAGTLRQITLSDINFNLDKTEVFGKIAVQRARRNRISAKLQSESINFDNYLPPLTKQQQELSISEKTKLLINKLKFLNDVDLHTELLIQLGIYNKIPFENLTLNFTSEIGKLNIKQFHIGQLINATVDLDGKIENIGMNPSFDNLKYKITTNDFTSFKNKFSLNTPDWPLFTRSKNVDSEGIFSGTLNNANIQSTTKFEKITGTYKGRIFSQDDTVFFRGNLEIKAPDFIDFANQLNIEYNPANMGVSVHTFKADIEGKYGYWRTLNMNTFIGLNNFTGAFSYQKSDGKPKIKADIATNLFEFDRFIFSPQKRASARISKTQNTFLNKPVWNNTVMNFEPFTKFDLTGKFAIKNLSYLNDDIENVRFLAEIKNDSIDIKNFTATKNGTPVNAFVSIDLKGTKPFVKGMFELTNYPVENLGGSTYNIESGKANIKCNFEGPCSSELDFIKSGKADISFDISNPVFKGFNITAIESDLKERSYSEDLDNVLTKYLLTGKTDFNLIGGDIHLENMKYVLNNALMSSDSAAIDVTSEGSIDSWNTDTTFNLTFDSLKEKIEAVSYKWEGSLSNPTLIIQSDLLKNQYDAYWAKIEEEKKQAEQARIAALTNKMTKAQLQVRSEIQLIETEILPRIKKYEPESFDSRTQSVYHRIADETNDMLKTLKSFETTAQTQYTEQDVNDIVLKTEVFQPLLTELIKQADDNYMFDMQLHIAAAFNRIDGIYQNSLEKAQNYQNTLNSYTMRLMQLGSLVILTSLPEVQQYRLTIENSIAEIADAYNKALKAKTFSESEDTLALMSKFNKEISDLLAKVQEKLNTLNSALENLFEFVQDVVYFEQTGTHRKPKDKTDNKPADDKVQQTEQTTSDVSTSDNVQISESLPNETNENSEEKLPKKFIKQQEEPVVEKTEGMPQTTPVVEEIKVEQITPIEIQTPDLQITPIETKAPVIEQVEPLKPLLIQVQDDYSSKPAMSGTIMRKSGKTQFNTTTSNNPKTLLIPSDGQVAVGGKITRK